MIRPAPPSFVSRAALARGSSGAGTARARPALRGLKPRGWNNHRAFTLIELLVVIGIIAVLIALAVPAVLIAKKRGLEVRIKSDMAMIGTALNAYKTDFGTYPVFADPLSDQAANAASVPGNGNWLDTDSGGAHGMGVRGAVLLCRALLAPGPANTSQTSPNYPSNPGDDGADGPGFRVRVRISGTANGYPVLTGKIYGPYVDSSKFKLQYLNPPGSNGAQYPQEYPVLCDTLGNPILYYPASTASGVSLLGYTDPLSASSNANSRFNGYDNQYLLDSTSGGGSFSSTSDFAQLAATAGSSDFLLWSAGIDGKFGLVNGKSDDLTNFDLPPNLKK